MTAVMENKLILSDIVSQVAAKSNVSEPETELFLKELFAVVTEQLSEENPVKIKDFGTFKLTPIQSRESVDVNTGEKIEIAAHNRVGFVPSTTLKGLVNKPFSHFETVLLSEDLHFENVGISLEEEEEEMDEAAELDAETTSQTAGELKEEMVVSIETTDYSTFNIQTSEENLATNMTEAVYPRQRIRVTPQPQRQRKAAAPVSGIGKVFLASAAMVATALVWLSRKK